MARRRRLSASAYVEGVLAGNRGRLGEAITLVESRRPADGVLAQEVLRQLLPHTGRSIRVGLTGVPGVGKSTLIDTLGMQLLAKGHRVAVLAVDPSSALSGGSILGDKTRMAQLSVADGAFIRPSPSGLTLGGVSRRTREAMLLCEAAGFDIIIVETVGVGQSEVVVSEMVDCFTVLMLPGAGDELQGIKKGILELADIIAVNKADGDNVGSARDALREYTAALRYLQPRHAFWRPRTLAVSGMAGDGLTSLWETILEHHQALRDNKALRELRDRQRLRWMWSMIEDRLLTDFRRAPAIIQRLAAVESAVRDHTTPPGAAADALLAAFYDARRSE